MKKIGLLLAFFGLFALSLSAQDPRPSKAVAGHTPKNTVPVKRKLPPSNARATTNMKVSRPAQAKQKTIVNPR